MSENYIVINRKKAELTVEQLAALGLEPDNTKHSPFARVQYGQNYFMADDHCASPSEECNDELDDQLFDDANYFTDENFARQVALHQLLYRKLLKFAYEHECEDTAEWNGEAEHFCVYHDIKNKDFDINSNCNAKNSCVYFNSRRGAERAIKEVVEPFMKEDPEFVW